MSQQNTHPIGGDNAVRLIPGPAVEGSIATGCFSDMKSFIKNGKVEKIVAVIKSCMPDMLGDLTVTLKDILGISSGTIHYKVLNDEVYGKAISGITAPHESQTLVLMQEDHISSVPISDAIDAENELVSSHKSITNGEHKYGNESTKLATSSEASNGYTSVSDHVTYQAAETLSFYITKSTLTLFEGEYNNQQVALKRLNITNLNNIKPKLLDEILTVARFQKHPNVVALIRFCEEKSNEIILVYEYVRSGNLADKMSKHLNAIQRLEICLDAARGHEYLHTGVDKSTPGIVHGHIKLSKIMLNSEPKSSRFKEKVSGFGFLRLLIGDVHFDIHNEIKTEALETYAKITCRSVIKNPEERLTMTRVVIELEKALRLQGGEVSNIHILGGRIRNGLTKERVIEVDQPEDDKPEEESKVVEETIVEDKPEEESKVVEETIVEDKPEEESKVFDETIGTDETEESKVIEQIAEDIEDAKKENGESAEEITVNTKPKEEPLSVTLSL
uniref:Tyrosine-protein kinase, non-receptor Jak2 n=1 Tax=Tanacetum cinerariifolium TaxID=118510 RepID=A0A6L2JA59_TANCI|nr:tyrosine-protein kinase, non-receptor Jak2 [Tanacetum cinerariifolium]